MRLVSLLLILAGCSASAAGVTPPPPADAAPPTLDATSDAASPGLPPITFCGVDSSGVGGAFTTQSGARWVAYACKSPCADWAGCAVNASDQNGVPLFSARGNVPMKELAFVVDGMGGQLVYTPDGDKTLVTHAGDGGTTIDHELVDAIVAQTNVRAVIVSWQRGWTGLFDGLGSGWFTPKDANPTTLVAQTARVASVLQWIHDNMAGGNTFGTAACSMGTVATFGARAWHDLDPVIDYQMLMGGPAVWDVNAGCGRVHYTNGYCDADASPCIGNPLSMAGQSDPPCPGGDPANLCRVPETMFNPNYDLLFDTLYQTNQCAPVSPDQRDVTLDTSSLLSLPSTTFAFQGQTDFTADEGGGEPDDERAGEGHALQLFHAIQGQKNWFDDPGAHHCDSFKNATKIPTTVARIRAGMGL